MEVLVLATVVISIFLLLLVNYGQFFKCFQHFNDKLRMSWLWLESSSRVAFLSRRSSISTQLYVRAIALGPGSHSRTHQRDVTSTQHFILASRKHHFQNDQQKWSFTHPNLIHNHLYRYMYSYIHTYCVHLTCVMSFQQNNFTVELRSGVWRIARWTLHLTRVLNGGIKAYDDYQ